MRNFLGSWQGDDRSGARSSHRWGSIGVIEREVSGLNLFQTPRPASPKVIFQNAKVLLNSYIVAIDQGSSATKVLAYDEQQGQCFGSLSEWFEKEKGILS